MQRVEDSSASQHRLRAKDPRAAMQASLRDIRAKLAHNTVLKPEFEYELLAMFVRNELSARVTLPAAGGDLLARLDVLGAGDPGLGVARHRHLGQVLHDRGLPPIPGIAAERGERRQVARKFVWLELFSGVTWGGMAVVGLGTADAASHVFMLASLIVLLAIRMTFASAVMEILYVSTIPMTWPWSCAADAGTSLLLWRWLPWRSACTSTSSCWPKASTPPR
jgi:two-component system cell cycle sensor histidine kinase PleC